jgi:hypothetical protein
MDDWYGLFIRRRLATKHAEALEWLRAGSTVSFRNLGEMSMTTESIEFVQHLYDLGAVDDWGEGHIFKSPANIEHLWEELYAWFDRYFGR